MKRDQDPRNYVLPHFGFAFIAVAVLIHAVVYWRAQPRPEPYLYSSRGGVPTRANKQTGVIEFAGPKGWHPYGVAQ